MKMLSDLVIQAINMEPNISCDECGKAFASRQKFQMHIVSTHKKTCCDKCGMCFNNKFNLKQHFLTKHSKSMNYLCEKCPKEYTRKEHLKKA